MFSREFKKELVHLRRLGQIFAKNHPSLAPHLKGQSSDPDVERFLEGTAFLSAGIKKKLDQNFDKFVYFLMQTICPHFLMPLPAATTMVFTPKETLLETMDVPKGTYIDSIPVDKTRCRFQTCDPVRVSPLRIIHAGITNKESPRTDRDLSEIKISFELPIMPLDSLDLEGIRLFLADEYASAADIYQILLNNTEYICITPEEGTIFRKNADFIKPGGLEEKAPLFPWPQNISPAARPLMEYFHFPEKFLYVDIDISQWKNKGSGHRFTLSFYCTLSTAELPLIETKSFVLSAVPCVNLFETEAAPIINAFTDADIQILPDGMELGTYEVFSVDKAAVFAAGDRKKKQLKRFSTFGYSNHSDIVYSTFYKEIPGEDQQGLYMTMARPQGQTLPEQEVITIAMTCTNGRLSGVLHPGDLHQPTANSPEMVQFRNISSPTPGRPPLESTDCFVRLLSHLYVNYGAVSQKSHLESLLALYSDTQGADRTKDAINRGKIDAIQSISLQPDERIIQHALYRGESIHIRVKQEYFASRGDLYLFGSVLDYYFTSCASINTYTLLTIEDVQTGDMFKWPARLRKMRLE